MNQRRSVSRVKTTIRRVRPLRLIGISSFAAFLAQNCGAAIFSFSAAAAASKRHSAYSFRRATNAYRWHPPFGRTLQVSYNRRGKDLTCIYTDERPDLARELPNWMFDERYCASMSLGPPQVGIPALNAFAAMPAAGGKSARRGSRWRPSEAKEAFRAQEKEPG
jgi:hypothetical protein